MKEMYDIIQTLFKNRGANKACGYCSRKIQCRVREDSEKRSFGCKPKQMKMVDEECEGHEACQLSLVLGGCPAPMPQHHMSKMQHHKRGHHFGQQGQFHHYKKHWGHGFGKSGESGSQSGEGRRWGGHWANDDVLPDGNDTDSLPMTSQEKLQPTSSENHDMDGNDTSSSGSAESHSGSAESGESGEQWGRHRNHTGLPLWHCVKSKDGKNCLCCCGKYFPDVNTGLCKAVRFGDKLPVFDLWSLTSGGMPTEEHK